MNDQVIRRRIERHCAASIRALSGCAGAEFRAQRLLVGERTVKLAIPHLYIDVVQHPLVRVRGVADAMALRLVYSDPQLHRAQAPKSIVSRIVFDVLEQVRVECLVPDSLSGMRQNIQYAFDLWCLESRGSGLIENEVGLLLFSITHIVRSRLRNQALEDEIGDIVESTRFRLAPIVGVQLSQLRAARFDQRRYAPLALAIARAISDTCDYDEEQDSATLSTRFRLQLPPSELEQSDSAQHADSRVLGVGSSGDTGASDYHIYTCEYDQQVSGRSLYREVQRRQLRQQLDKLVAAQALSVPRLARRLQNVFAMAHDEGWNFGQEQGYLDGCRLTQLVANPAYRNVFKSVRQQLHTDIVVSFLLDNSGSMKRQRFEAVAVLVDMYARALELIGAKTEILGFTTVSWSGGQACRQWQREKSAAQPGRVNDRLHIVYKDADTSWRRARDSIASLLNPQHFREGLDGEALGWAAGRLRQYDTRRRALVMISDGAPMDSATLKLNDPGYLDRHLHHVAKGIERSGDIELRAIGIGLDMGEFFRRSIALDLTGTLANVEFSALERLFLN